MEEQQNAGRPVSKEGNRVRIGATLEPQDLAHLRRYAKAQDDSIGRTIDKYVKKRFLQESAT